MAYVALNFGTSTLASGINASATTINVQTGHGVRFAVGSDYSYLVLENTGGNTEIVKITGQTGDVLTVVRAQDGTTARSWLTGDAIESRPCAAAIADILAEATTAGTSAVSSHLSDTTAAHAASAISYSGSANLAATDVEGALDELDAEKAPLESPTLTGTPAAPTAAPGTKTTQIATTDFVATAVPPGTVIGFPGTSAPTGYLKANGANVSRTTYANLFAALVTNAGFTSQTFTVTIATPAVFTKTGHGFNGGERLRISTAGVLPTGLNTSSDYFVEKIDTNTFYLCSDEALTTRINTSGAQSGVHSYLQSWWGLGDGSTTFTLPDLRGEFPRYYDDGRGVDTNRAFGSYQASQNLAHNHSLSTDGAHTHTLTGTRFTNAGGDFGVPDGTAGTSYTTSSSGSHTHTVGSSGGTEARPRNKPLLACIKF